MLKKIPVIILIVILFIFSIFVIPSFALNEFTSSNKFYMEYNNNYVILPMIAPCSRYNPDTDLLIAGYNNKSDFNSYCILVVVNGKQYSNPYDYKIYQSSDNWHCINVVNQSTNAQITLNYYAFRYNNSLWGNWGGLVTRYDTWANNNIDICKTDFDLYKQSTGELISSKSSFDNLPFIANTTEQLENVSVGELAIGDNGVAPSLLNITLRNNTTSTILFTINLTDYADYISRLDLSDPFSNFGYVIPWKNLPQFSFIENNQYTIYIDFGELMTISKTFIVRKSISSTDIPLTNVPEPPITPTPDPNQSIIDSNKETQNKLDEQTNAIKEQTETNKNIFQKIGDILDLLNPFSDNFFGKKLVELILNGIKSLFVPEDGFFSNYFNEIKEWFSDRLGFLWSPFDFLIELLTRISNINFNEPKFNIPDIYEPFTNNKIISATEFNFNDFLDNSILKTAHDIYLLLVDGFIIFSLYKLISAKIEEVFTK